jgi:hypothetical protein
LLIPIAAAVSFSSLPVAAQEVESAPNVREPLPLEYPPPAARTALAVTGAAVFVGWYGLAVGASFLDPDAPHATDLRIPVVGPWMAVANAGCNRGDPDCSTAWVVVRAILHAMDGIGQVGGLAVLGEALFLPTRDHVRAGVVRPRAGNARATSSTAPTFRAVPLVGAGDSVGLGLHGTF